MLKDCFEKAYSEFIVKNGGLKNMEDSFKEYLKEAIEDGEGLDFIAECFVNDLDSFDGYLIDEINNLISDAKINVTIEF